MKTIFLLEDDNDIRQVIHLILEEENYKVILARLLNLAKEINLSMPICFYLTLCFPMVPAWMCVNNCLQLKQHQYW